MSVMTRVVPSADTDAVVVVVFEAAVEVVTGAAEVVVDLTVVDAVVAGLAVVVDVTAAAVLWVDVVELAV